MSLVWRDIAEGYEAAFTAKREVFGEDLCDVFSITFSNDGTGGAVASETLLASNVECFYKAKGQFRSFVAGGQTVFLTHDLELKMSDPPLTFRPEYKIRVIARDGKPEIIFENLVPTVGSFTPLVRLEASMKI